LDPDSRGVASVEVCRADISKSVLTATSPSRHYVFIGGTMEIIHSLWQGALRCELRLVHVREGVFYYHPIIQVVSLEIKSIL